LNSKKVFSVAAGSVLDGGGAVEVAGEGVGCGAQELSKSVSTNRRQNNWRSGGSEFPQN